MSAEENKAIMRRFIEEVFNEGRVDRAEEFVARDYTDHGALPGQAPGIEGAKQRWAMFSAAIPDMRTTIEDLVAEGDKVAVRYAVEGTHRGEMMGIPPTGKRFRFQRHQHQPHGRGEARGALGGDGYAGPDAAARRHPRAGAGRPISPGRSGRSRARGRRGRQAGT